MDQIPSQEITYTYYVGSYPYREHLSQKDWQKFKLEELFFQNDGKRIIANHNQKPIGSIVFCTVGYGNETIGHISYLEVMMNYRKQKIGSILLALATCELIEKDHCLWVTVNSLEDSMQFYEKNKYEHVIMCSYLLKAKSAEEVRNIMGKTFLPILNALTSHPRPC